MKNFYCLCFAIVLAFGLQAQAVTIPTGLNTGSDGIVVSWIDAFIEADTNEMGEQNHTIYQLEPNGNYAFTVSSRWNFPVTIESLPRQEGDFRPFIFRVRRDGGDNPPSILRGTSDFTLRGVHLEAGFEGLDAPVYETLPIAVNADSTRVIIEDCIIEQARQTVIRHFGNGNSTYVRNNLLRNFGDRYRLQGNGRVVDIRQSDADSVVISGNVIHNFLDRIFIGFRQTGLNYFELSENTIFNHVGRHGFVQLKNTKESVIRDNLIQNPSIIGSPADGVGPTLSDEQINLDNIATPIFTLDTLPDGGSLTMTNNNVYWTEDVLNHYATFDSVQKPDLFSPVFEQALIAGGGSVDDAAFSEVLELNNVPGRAPLIQYSREAILYQDSVGITDIIVQDSVFIDFLGRQADFPYVFNFAAFDPCYDPSSTSATAASDGGGVGAIGNCNQLWPVSIPRTERNNAIELTASPNPAQEVITFTYKNFTPGEVRLVIVDMQGKIVDTVVTGSRGGALQTVRYNRLNELAAGMYVALVATPSGQMSTKFVKR